MGIQQRFQKSDMLWLLAYPLYQVIGTVRHEGSHALVALVEGAKIEQFVVLPSIVGANFCGATYPGLGQQIGFLRWLNGKAKK
jgi:hypothetical protein